MVDVILDRDGVLNVDVGYTHRLEDFRFPENALEGLRRLQGLGARLSVATGQSGIAREKYLLSALFRFNAELIDAYAAHGIAFAAFAHCPHHPKISGDCRCRKPNTGMLKQIDEQIGPIDWTKAWGIGDKPDDAQMILAMGGRAILIESGPHNNTTGEQYWRTSDEDVRRLVRSGHTFVAHDLLQAATIITNRLSG